MAKSKTMSAATQARLASIVKTLGRDVLQPTPHVLATPWAQNVLAASRVQLEQSVKVIGPGFDYGPLQKTPFQWVIINRLARAANPDWVWQQAISGAPAAPAAAKAKSNAKVKAAPQPVAPQPAVNITPIAQPATGPLAGPPPVVHPPVAPSVIPEAGVVPEAEVMPHPVVVRGLLAKTCKAERLNPQWDWQDAASVFGMPSLKGRVAVWPQRGQAGAHQRAIEVDTDYVWDEGHLQWAIHAAGCSPAKGVWYWGNRGAGKTEFARQFAARTGRPYYNVTFTDDMVPLDFLGGTSMVNGNAVWADGTLLIALREMAVPPVVLLDEITMGKSSHISGPLNEIISMPCSFNVPGTGERIDFHKSCFFIAADNTNGTGDPTSMFEGTTVSNRATVDRFAYSRRFTYMPKAAEIKLIKARAECDDDVALKAWSMINALRAKVSEDKLTDAPSIREAVAFASALEAGFDERDAFECSFVGKYPDEAQEEMRVTFTAVFKSSDADE